MGSDELSRKFGGTVCLLVSIAMALSDLKRYQDALYHVLFNITEKLQ